MLNRAVTNKFPSINFQFNVKKAYFFVIIVKKKRKEKKKLFPSFNFEFNVKKAISIKIRLQKFSSKFVHFKEAAYTQSFGNYIIYSYSEKCNKSKGVYVQSFGNRIQ